MGRLLKEMLIIGVAFVAAIYLINPTAGLLEFIPDWVPFVGNLDEAMAMLLLINTLAYYGFDLTKLFGNRLPTQKNLPALGQGLYQRDQTTPQQPR